MTFFPRMGRVKCETLSGRLTTSPAIPKARMYVPGSPRLFSPLVLMFFSSTPPSAWKPACMGAIDQFVRSHLSSVGTVGPEWKRSAVEGVIDGTRTISASECLMLS